MVKIFIGTSSNGEDRDIEMVLEHTLRKNTDVELEITWMRQTNDKDSFWGDWKTAQWSTPFSGYRWAIPEACNFEGQAIYMDTDMINFKDINILHSINMGGKPFAARRGYRFGGHEFCVMIFDCVKSQKVLPPVVWQKCNANSHQSAIFTFSGNQQHVHDMDPRWNCLDGEQFPVEDIWHLHYTKMNSQPWRPSWFTGKLEEHARPDINDVYFEMLDEAKHAGCVPPENEADRGSPVEYNIIGQ